jgi:2-phosphosulfolactate phosphatase
MKIDLIPYYFPGCEAHYEPSEICFLIDVYRASSMMVALAHCGAEKIFLAAGVSAAERWKERHPEVLLFGERGGFAPPGFDGGNSPSELETRSLTGRSVVLATSNGSRAAVGFGYGAGRMVALSLVNLKAAVSWIERNLAFGAREGKRVAVLCSGSQNRFSMEDFCVAALFWNSLKQYDEETETDEKALAASIVERLQDEFQIRTVFNGTTHAKTLRRQGFQKDLDWILHHYNRMSILPEVTLLKTDSTD